MSINEEQNAYLKRIAERIKRIMDQKKITQSKLLSLAAQQGYCIRQSTLSKILSEASSMSITTIVPIANILGIDLNDLFSEKDSLEVRLQKDPTSSPNPSKLIRRADSSEMRPYLNKYHTYFFPTLSSDERILSGMLEFFASPDSSRCLATFCFETGKKGANGNPIVKKYDGELVLSQNMSAAYCTLANEEYGEISYLIFSYFPILFESLQCRVALVLTSSAGANRMPTVHRMIISKDAVPSEMIEVLRGQLYLNESEILISEIGLKQFWNDPRLDPSFKEYFQISDQESGFLGLRPVPYYLFDEAVIRGAFLAPKVKTDAINLIRQYSSSPKYNKIGSKCDEIVYRTITSQSDKRI